MGFSTEMYTAVLEDLKLEQEKSSSKSRLITSLQEALSACEEKLAIANLRSKVTPHEKNPSIDTDDSEPATTPGRYAMRSTVRVRVKLCLHYKAFRRHLLAKIEASSKARSARQSLLTSLLHQQQITSETESRNEGHIHDLSARLRQMSKELRRTKSVASEVDQLRSRCQELQVSLGNVLSIASSHVMALQEKDQMIAHLQGELEESKKAAASIKGLEWRLDKAWNELAAERLKSISYERAARVAKKQLTDHLENELWKTRMVTYSNSNSNSNSNLFQKGKEEEEVDSLFARRSIRHSSPGDGARRGGVDGGDKEDRSSADVNSNEMIVSLAFGSPGPAVLGQETRSKEVTLMLSVAAKIDQGQGQGQGQGKRRLGRKKSLLSAAILASCPTSPAASGPVPKSIFSSEPGDKVAGGAKADGLNHKPSALAPQAANQPRAPQAANQPRGACVKFSHPSVIVEEPSFQLQELSAQAQGLITVTDTSPPSGPLPQPACVPADAEGGQFQVQGEVGEEEEGEGEGEGEGKPEGASLPEGGGRDNAVDVVGVVRAFSSEFEGLKLQVGKTNL